MPLVHIIAGGSQRAKQLEMDLRNRGFEVQVVSDSADCGSVPDFEISANEYSIEEALRLAVEMAASENISVLIAPGAMAESPISPRVQPAVSRDSTPLIPVFREDQLPSDVAEAVPATEFTRMEHEAAEDVALPEIAAEIPIIQSEPVPLVTEPLPALPETSQSQEVPVMIDSTPGLAEPAAEAVVPELEAIRSELDEVVPDLEPAFMSESAEPAQGVLTPQFLEAEETAEPVSDWPIWHPATEEPVISPVQPAPAVIEPVVQSRTEKVVGHGSLVLAYRSMRNRLNGSERTFWRTATVAALVAICALVLGASYHRVAPVPAGVVVDEIPAQSSVPISIPARSNKAQDVRSIPVRIPRSAPAVKSTAVRERVASHEPEATSEPDVIAPDTVVRYNRRPPAVPARPTKRVVSSAHSSESEVVAEDTVTHFEKVPQIAAGSPRK